MCAGKSSPQPVEASTGQQDSGSSSTDVNSSSASYRVLRSGRQRPWRSVDRETAGRNVSEAIEPRQVYGVWMPSHYLYDEGNTSSRTESRSIGVQEHGMRSRSKGEPWISRQSVTGDLGDRTRSKVSAQGIKPKTTLMPGLEVRWFNSSAEFGNKFRNEMV
jgi:hypothetical protein